MFLRNWCKTKCYTTKKRHSIKQNKESFAGTARLFIIKNNIRESTARNISKHAVLDTDQGFVVFTRTFESIRSHAIDHTRATHQEHLYFERTSR